MPVLSFTRVTDVTTAQAWAQVHNRIIPNAPLSVDHVVDRSEGYILDLAKLDRTVVGCSTVRPATVDEPVTVIARILPAFRRRGFGSALLAYALTHAQGLEALAVQTIVLASNSEGLEFALRRGFVETDRYTLDGETVPYVHLEAALDRVVT
jgi:GNAT superfamily N-acetyltransferase